MATLKQRLKRNLLAVEEISNDPDGAGGGSPLESIYDRIDDLEKEIARREAQTKSTDKS